METGSILAALAIAAHVLVARLRTSERSFRLLAENATDVVYRYRLHGAGSWPTGRGRTAGRCGSSSTSS